MQRLTDRHGTPTIIRGLRFLGIQLGRRPETRPLEAPVTSARTALQEASEAWLQAREERVAASAELHYLDGLVDAAVARLARRVLMDVDNDRTHPTYVRLFPAAPSELTRPTATDEQSRFVDALVAQVREGEDLADLRGLGDEIAQAQEALRKALAAREALYVEEGKAAAARRVALDAARRAYNLAAPRLQLLFPEDPALVESFFLRFVDPRLTGGEEEGEEAVVAVDGPPAEAGEG